MGLCWSDSPPFAAATPCRGCGLSENRPGQAEYCYRCQPQRQTVAVSNPQFQLMIQVRTLTGLTIPLWTNSYEPIYRVKQRVQQVLELPPERQILLYLGKQLDDRQTIGFYSIQNGHTLHVVMRLA